MTPLWRFPQVAEAYMKTATTGRRVQNPTRDGQDTREDGQLSFAWVASTVPALRVRWVNATLPLKELSVRGCAKNQRVNKAGAPCVSSSAQRALTLYK